MQSQGDYSWEISSEFEIGLSGPKYAIWWNYKKSFFRCPGHVGVSDWLTQVTKFFWLEISILDSKYAIWRHSEKSVRGAPRHPRVADQPTIVSIKKFRLKNRHFERQICDLASFWKTDPERPEAPDSRQPTPSQIRYRCVMGRQTDVFQI